MPVFRAKPICLLAALAVIVAPTTLASADEQAAVNGCIDRLREEGGPDGQSGEVISQDFSEAGTLVMLKDASGKIWRCIGYSDGTVGEFSAETPADDGAGAIGGGPTNSEERVRFQPGASGATLVGDLTSSSSVRYLLGAKSEQSLDVKLTGNSEFLNYTIYLPDGNILFESSQGGYDYRGRLFETGDHVVEVFYNGDVGTSGSYELMVTID
ncbi:MAG: hypothetical protein AAGF74_10675 [Pseudomonadota bacterium]